MQALARNVGILSRNNGALASMLSLLNAGEMPSEPKELRILLQDTGHLARETGELLLRLQQECALNEAGSGREQVALGKLSRDFQLVLRRFQQLAEDSAQHAATTSSTRAAGVEWIAGAHAVTTTATASLLRLLWRRRRRRRTQRRDARRRRRL